MVGLKPYPEYKPSAIEWLGAVPAHWQISPGFSAYRQKQEKNTGLVEETVLSLSYGKIVVKPPERLHGLVPESFETYQIINPNDIIIRPTDLQNDWNSLRVGIARNRGIITSAYLCLNTTGVLEAEYAYLLLHTYDLMKVFYGMGSGLRQNLDYSDLKRMPVLVPPKDEQQRIVRFLNHIDRRVNRFIRAKRRLIELLNEQKQAIIHQAVTRGLDPNVRLKPSGVEWLGDVPEHWELRRFKYVAQVNTGQVDPRLHPFSDYTLIAPNHVERATGRILYEETAAQQGADSGKYLVRRGQVVYSKIRPNLRKAAIAPGDCLCSADMYAISPNPPVLRPQFLALLLISIPFTRYAIGCSMRVAMPKINREALGNGWLWFPSLQEQDEILHRLATHLLPWEAAISLAVKGIALVREYHTRLITDVVTGKLDVRDVELPETEGSNAFDTVDIDDAISEEELADAEEIAVGVE